MLDQSLDCFIEYGLVQVVDNVSLAKIVHLKATLGEEFYRFFDLQKLDLNLLVTY